MSEAITITPILNSELRAFVESRSGQKIQECYQCGKCSAGCPAAYAMDLTPRQVMRAIQLGLEEDVLHSTTIWVCLQCQICSVRCPRLIDIAKVMEALRILSFARGVKPAVREAKVFHKLFLDIIKDHGRMYEFRLAGSYNLLSGHLFSNLGLVPAMLLKGKLSLLPSRLKGTAEVKDIFNRVQSLESKRH